MKATIDLENHPDVKVEYKDIEYFNNCNDIAFLIDDQPDSRKGVVLIPIDLFDLKARKILDIYFPNHIEYIKYFPALDIVAFGFFANDFSIETIYNILYNTCVQVNLAISGN
ncbi:MAG: hypothetical protein GY754_40145 [bacterium]|nr:hypothetical protein [bacterium]